MDHAKTDYQRWLVQVQDRIVSVPDFPQPGVLYRDITPVLSDATGLQAALGLMEHQTRSFERKISKVMAIESRGFLFGMSVAERIGAGFVLARKPGKLPRQTVSAQYDLEYGSDRVEVHADSIRPGEPVLIVDDLLATGGTARAAMDLVEELRGVVVGALFLIELSQLGGRGKLAPTDVRSVLAL